MNSNYLENSKNINLKDYEKTLIKRKKELEKLTKIYNRKLSKINEILNFNLENEKCKDECPISLRYNTITEKNNIKVTFPLENLNLTNFVLNN
jgi:hypothetical protein